MASQHRGRHSQHRRVALTASPPPLAAPPPLAHSTGGHRLQHRQFLLLQHPASNIGGHHTLHRLLVSSCCTRSKHRRPPLEASPPTARSAVGTARSTTGRSHGCKMVRNPERFDREVVFPRRKGGDEGSLGKIRARAIWGEPRSEASTGSNKSKSAAMYSFARLDCWDPLFSTFPISSSQLLLLRDVSQPDVSKIFQDSNPVHSRLQNPPRHRLILMLHALFAEVRVGGWVGRGLHGMPNPSIWARRRAALEQGSMRRFGRRRDGVGEPRLPPPGSFRHQATDEVNYRLEPRLRLYSSLAKIS